MSYFNSLILAALLVLSGPGASSEVKQPQPTPPAKAASFRCTPSVLHDGDTLTIRISTPHGGDLAIWDPNDRFFFLVFWQPEDPPAPRPLIDRQLFQSMPVLRLNTREAVAPILNEGWEAPTRIFTKPGKYHVVLSVNLETENTKDTFNECVVVFRGPKP